MNRNNDLCGLVLAGGKSTRMGRDKSMIPWHGIPHWLHIARLLQPFCNNVYVSRREQSGEDEMRFPVIKDAFEKAGPATAILSAFLKKPETAWVVVACDLALINSESIRQLITSRDSNKMATAFQSPRDGSPEPLACIWEPSARAVLLDAFSNDHVCPRKLLMAGNNVKLIAAGDETALMNVNTPEDAAYAESLLKTTDFK